MRRREGRALRSGDASHGRARRTGCIGATRIDYGRREKV
ncbi:hypothetical protein C7S17_6888 [Burkholderia thailandensis]|nr:hypothetical protein [Burkholderia thailandensis]